MIQRGCKHNFWANWANSRFPHLNLSAATRLDFTATCCYLPLMIYDEALMACAARAFAEKVMDAERVEGAVGWRPARSLLVNFAAYPL
jgi:hypothetical protein